MMETVLYDDYNSMHNNFLTAGMNNQLKRKLTLDLDFGAGGDGSGINPKQMSVIKKAKVASLNTPSSLAILSSPDLYKLNLASPELEKLIIHQASTLPTPNPTQNQIFFPKNVTEEQEAYVQGFTEALSKLHENPPVTSVSGIMNNNLGMSNNVIINSSTSIQSLANATLLTEEQQQQFQILQLNNAQRIAQQEAQSQHSQPPPYSYDHDTSSSDDSTSENSCSNSNSSSISYSKYGHMVLPTTIPSLPNSAHAAFPVVVTSANNNSIVHHRLPDYQLNPMGNVGGATGSSGNIAAIPISTAGYSSQSPNNIHIKEEPQTVPNVSSPAPVSPIDMESQEKIKLERKRQRNRLAASKCRKRKLERISKLEDKVKQLKGENADLSTVLAKLKDTVCTLKQQVMEHVNSGCQIIISPNLSTTF